jgi:hypothetical protein
MWNSGSLFPLSTVKEDNVTGEKTAEFKALKNCNYATPHLYFNENIKFSSQVLIFCIFVIKS